jgi:hypothetical protein
VSVCPDCDTPRAIQWVVMSKHYIWSHRLNCLFIYTRKLSQFSLTLGFYMESFLTPWLILWRIDPWLCKQWPLLGNPRSIHERNNRTTVLCNPFLGNGSVNTPTTIELLLEAVFCVRCVQRCYKEDNWGSRVKMGSNTSTVALRVVGGDEKGTQCLGV